MNGYDVVVAGAGHNGLVAAAYLAKAGLSVCVVERNEHVGGGVVTRELTLPGFKHDLASLNHALIHANPLIEQDELGLVSKYGLKYVFPEAITALVFPDDTSIVLYKDLDKTCTSIGQFSNRDAEAYRKLHDWAKPLLQVTVAGMFSVPPPLGTFFSMLEQSEEGRELLRAMLVSAQDIANEWFESNEARMLATRFVAEGGMDPQIKGTGYTFLTFVPFFHKYGSGVPIGGSGVLSDLLAQCVEDNGGVIRTSSTARSIKVEGGEAKGVVLDTGEEILAKKALISNLNIKQVANMVGETELSPEFMAQVNRLQPSSYAPFLIHMALNEYPEYKVGAEVTKAWYVMPVPATTEEYSRIFDGFKYGLQSTSLPLAACSTLFDASRAPAGKHTLYLFHFEPYKLKDGAARWDEIKEDVADGILETLQEHTTNMDSKNILAKSVFSPLDFERYNASWVEGDDYHIGSFLHQSFAMRPVPGWGQYRTPIKKLYLCGPSTHPGGSVTGGSRITAQIVMEDLGIDFEKVIK